MSGARTCGNEGSSTGEGVREVAVVGPRVAWIVNEGGNTYLGVGRVTDRGAVVFLPMSSLR